MIMASHDMKAPLFGPMTAGGGGSAIGGGAGGGGVS